MHASETMQARRAALMLHGLPPAVRGQVLAKLDAQEAKRLAPLLEELVALGVAPSLGQQLQAIERSHAEAQSTAAPPSELTTQQRVAQLNADVVARCLQACSPLTAAELLRAAEWPWKAQVLGLIPEPRRTRVLDAMRREPRRLAPAVSTLLCEHLLRQAAQFKSIGSQAASESSQSGCVGMWRPATRSKLGARLRRLMPWTR